MVLVLFGTLEQPRHGIWPVQKHYFEAWLATWPMPATPDATAAAASTATAASVPDTFRLVLPMPGGYALGLALLVNLACAAARFFRPSWRKLGLALIHVGVVVLLAGGFAISAWQEEYFMEIPEGQSRDYVTNPRAPAAAAAAAAPANSTPESPAALARVSLPFALHLDKFTHEVHPGSNIPKNYSSSLRLAEAGTAPAEGRPVLVRMNNPLRHGGFSFYQSSFRHAPDGSVSTILQVVRNPGWALPYAAFYLVGAGMLLQFLTTLLRFLAKGRAAPARAAALLAAALFTATATTATTTAAAAEPGPPPPDSTVARAFAGLPVQYNGRLQPVDSLARNTLLLLRGKQSVAFTAAEATLLGVKPSAWATPDATLAAETGIRLTAEDRALLELRPVPIATNLLGKSTLDAATWLLEVAFRPTLAAHFPVFRVENTEVRDLLLRKPGAVAHYSWNELQPAADKIQTAYNAAIAKKPADRTSFEHGVVKLGSAMLAYLALGDVFAPADVPPGASPNHEYTAWAALLNDANAILKAANARANADADNAPPPMLAAPPPRITPEMDARLRHFHQRYTTMANEGRIGIIPPTAATAAAAGHWDTLGAALLPPHGGNTYAPPAPLKFYSDLFTAWQNGDNHEAAAAAATLRDLYIRTSMQPSLKMDSEVVFNRLEPFFKCLLLYGVAFLLVCLGWALKRPRILTAALWLTLLVLVLHTAAIGARMWIQDRPPVTNLYSTAVVVSWGAVLLGVFVERYLKNGVGLAAAAVTGFASLIIAHNLAMNGDTMGMMQAVLDDNFWLATHVVTITLGYSGMFIAGLLGALWIIRRLFGWEQNAAAEPLERAIYGVMCFALLLSFAGTMLGGLWADKSWGRFWGWDPKENGALLVVLWCAVFLHARHFRLAGMRGLAQLAVFGNIVTAASWFGTNLLSTGLHSYGFSEGGFSWLCAFWLSQLALIALAWLPVGRRL
jgi:ABC-type transport system involved in cytochrome c biogenesis permease subunit